jgi:hypothetical protein
MIDRIDAGYCIQNPGPNDRGRCDCYKYPVPYTLFGHDGAIMFCRGWIDYMMAYNDSWERIKLVRSAIIELLIEQYPLAASEECLISEYGIMRDGTLDGIRLYVTPAPFDLSVSFMPSFYIKHLHYYDRIRNNTYLPLYQDIPNGLKIKLSKAMAVLKERNARALDAYSIINKGRRVAKRHQVIMNEFLTKINNYETTV